MKTIESIKGIQGVTAEVRRRFEAAKKRETRFDGLEIAEDRRIKKGKDGFWQIEEATLTFGFVGKKRWTLLPESKKYLWLVCYNGRTFGKMEDKLMYLIDIRTGTPLSEGFDYITNELSDKPQGVRIRDGGVKEVTNI